MSREPLNPFFVHTTDGELTALQKDGLACIAIYVELWLRNADLFGVQGAFIREKLAIIGGQEAAFALLMETMIENGKARYENGRYFAATVTQ